MKIADYKYNEIIDKFEINKGDKIALLNVYVSGVLKKQIDLVSVEDIKKVASRILDENQIFFLVIGNPTDLKNAKKI